MGSQFYFVYTYIFFSICSLYFETGPSVSTQLPLHIHFLQKFKMKSPSVLKLRASISHVHIGSRWHYFHLISADSLGLRLSGLLCPRWRHHVAHVIAALCSFAFMRKLAMLEDLRSGSTLRSNPFMVPPIPELPKRLPMCVCPMFPPGLGIPRKSVTPLAEWGWGLMQEDTESQGTTQPGTGEAALLPLSQDGFWI